MNSEQPHTSAEEIELLGVGNKSSAESTTVTIPDEVFTGKLQTAYAKNNYDEFKKLLKSKSYGAHWISSMLRLKLPTGIFKTYNSEKNQFENLLVSKETKAGKYISLILEHFGLGHDETFLKQQKTSGEYYMDLVAKSQTVEILFSFLMFDWFKPKSKSEKSYCLVLKNEQYFKTTGEHLISRLMKIVESKTTKTLLKEIGVKIIYQIIHEIDLTREIISKFQSKIKLVQLKKSTEEKGSAVFVKLENKLKSLESQKEILVNRVELITDGHKTSFIDDAFRMKTEAGIDEKESFDNILMVLIVSLMAKRKLDYDRIKLNVTSSIYTKSYWEFFTAVFLLKEKRVVEFESCFEAWISAARKISDVEFQTKIKLQVQMLSNTAQIQKLQKASEFIFKLHPHIGVNLTIMSIWNSASDFQKYYYSEHPEVERLYVMLTQENCDLDEIINDFEKLFKTESNDETLKTYILGRKLNDDDTFKRSLYELVLSTAGQHKLVELITKRLKLNRNYEFLNAKSPEGKYLLNYVIDSKDERNLIEFLKSKPANGSMYQVSKSFQILKNIQFKKITGKTLFEHQIEICVREVIASEKVDRELKFDLFAILLSLLEEIELIKDIRTEVPIDKLLDYAKDEKFYLKILDGKITAEEIEKHEKELKPKIYFVDDILASFLIYWTQSDLNYDEYKQKFIELGTYFEMFIDIIEGNDEKLIRNFLESVKKIEKVFQVRYQKVSYEPNDVTNFLANLLFAAIRHGRTNVIDRIFDYENFITTEFQFPPNMRCDKTTRYVTTQLLQNGIELGSETIPENWLLPQDFEKFLDSRINYNNQDLIEIDTSFMIHRKTRKQHIESNTDVDNNNMFWEDTRSLEYIVENKLLKEFVTHPVISTYIDLKTFKHQRILLWNFFMFLCFLILIFAFVIAYSSYGSSSKIWNFILFPIVVLSLREYFQLSCIDETWKNYLKKTSNRIEICLIFFLTLTWILSLIESGSIAEFTDLYIIDYIVFFSLEDVIKFLKITSIFLTTGSFLLTLPFGSMQVYMMMVKKVAKNFFKFFFAMCFSILFAYAVSFRLIFSSSFEKNPKEALKLFGNETEAFDEFTTLESATEEPNNFERFDSALLKVVMMLSGEFGIEPVTLTFFQIIFFASFVLMSFILFNLILGMAIDNVQTLQSEARKLILTKNAKRFIEAHKLCYKVYKNLRLDVFETSELSRFQRVKVWILRHGLSTSPTIHKLDKFYVNLKTHKISMTINGTQEQIINESINSDAFDKIKEILRK